MSRLTDKNESICDYCEYERNNGCIKTDPAKCVFSKTWNELQHYTDLEEQLEKLYGDRLSLDSVVNNLNRIVQNGEEKLDFARILTNAEAEKWDRWKGLEEQGRLIEQKYGQWDYNKYKQMYCSNCGQYPEIAVEWNYCPNCGAKMEGSKW